MLLHVSWGSSSRKRSCFERIHLYLAVFFQEFLRKQSSLWEFVYPFFHMDIDVSVCGGLALEVVMLDYIVRHVTEF